MYLLKKKHDLKRNHNYFYQVQMQMKSCKLDLGFLVVYFNKGETHLEKINRDKNFWQQKMEALLPEIADGRVAHNMAIRAPFLGEWTDK